MKKHLSQELPIRIKVAMAQEISQVIECLHRGQRGAADLLLEQLKAQALFLDEATQQNVLIFAEQVAFQYDYDPWHKVTSEVVNAADKLVESLGFSKPELL
jgi:hypothetical protein